MRVLEGSHAVLVWLIARLRAFESGEFRLMLFREFMNLLDARLSALEESVYPLVRRSDVDDVIERVVDGHRALRAKFSRLRGAECGSDDFEQGVLVVSGLLEDQRGLEVSHLEPVMSLVLNRAEREKVAAELGRRICRSIGEPRRFTRTTRAPVPASE
jgi:hypothetical protein